MPTDAIVRPRTTIVMSGWIEPLRTSNSRAWVMATARDGVWLARPASNAIAASSVATPTLESFSMERILTPQFISVDRTQP